MTAIPGRDPFDTPFFRNAHARHEALWAAGPRPVMGDLVATSSAHRSSFPDRSDRFSRADEKTHIVGKAIIGGILAAVGRTLMSIGSVLAIAAIVLAVLANPVGFAIGMSALAVFVAGLAFEIIGFTVAASQLTTSKL
jgi:hypothetical protein